MPTLSQRFHYAFSAALGLDQAGYRRPYQSKELWEAYASKGVHMQEFLGAKSWARVTINFRGIVTGRARANGRSQHITNTSCLLLEGKLVGSL